jgi:hypothetical protein
MLPQQAGGLTLDTVEKTQGGIRWGREDTLPAVGGFETSGNVQHTNPFSNDFVANRAPGIRESVWDPTRLYTVPPSFGSTGNPVRAAAAADESHNSSFLTTPTMIRRQEKLYEILFIDNQQGFPFDDYGTFVTPYTGINLGTFRPYSTGNTKSI